MFFVKEYESLKIKGLIRTPSSQLMTENGGHDRKNIKREII